MGVSHTSVSAKAPQGAFVQHAVPMKRQSIAMNSMKNQVQMVS
jgi:hypothetical protein